MEEILHRAERLEKDYDWLGAAESYEKALGLLPGDDFSSKAEIDECLGYVYHRAAFQAESNDEFKEKLRLAVSNYEKAKENFKLNESEKTGRALRCDAMNKYIGYWLAIEATEKKRLLVECWQLTKDSLRASRETGKAAEYGETYTQLSPSALLGFCFEWDYQIRKRIVKEVVEHGEAGIKLLSTVDEPDELAKACARTAFSQSLYAYYFLDLDERENTLRKAQSNWTKAKETSEDSARLEMLCPVPCAHDDLWGFGTKEAMTNLERALEHCRSTGDRFIIGSALDWLAYHTLWSTAWIDDYDELAKVVRTIIQYAEDAKRQYAVISFISPRADNAWIEAIHAQLEPGYSPAMDLEKKRNMLEKVIAAGRDALGPAENSGYPDAVGFVHCHLGNYLRMLAEIESNPEEKRKMLEEALQHGKEFLRIGEQIGPLSYWDLGVQRVGLAETKCALADLATDSETKKGMLQAAILERENAIKLWVKDLSYQLEEKTASLVNMGRNQYLMGCWWSRLYRLTGDKEHLKKSAEVLTEAIESYQKINRTSGTAECYWKIAQAHDELGDHLTAAENFGLASDTFRSAAEKMPPLKSFYEDHALYMQAWNEIEKARHHHERQEYGLAKEHFERAAELHQPLKKWSYLESNYSAWAQVENAEELSRKEQSEEAIRAFEEASKLFNETKKSLQAQLSKIEDTDEKQMANNMTKASDLRQKYCDGRIAIEEAKILDKTGNHSAGSEKYGSASEIFERICRTLESERERKEFKFIINLSRAWQKMMLADARASPELYLEASTLFELATKESSNETSGLLALGHSRFCRALEAGTRFADTGDATLHTTAIQQLESAAKYYARAGFQSASEYAKATGLLLDAYAHMNRAKKEEDPGNRAKLYTIAEKVLQTSAGSYMKAEHPEKRELVMRLLDKVKEERELAVSIAEVLHPPSVVSATTSFVAPTPSSEEAVGSERFEHADIQANLIVRQKELKVGEPLNLEIELVNAGKGPALLVRVNEVIPEGFELGEKPDTCRVEDSYIDMKGKRLAPLKTEELRLILKPKIQGTFTLKPTVLYLDDSGKYKSHEVETVTIVVKELGIKGWLKGER